MKMTNLIMTAAVSVATLLVACSPSAIVKSYASNGVSVSNGKESNATVSKTVRISDFDGVYACQGIKIVFTQGDNPGTARIATTPSAEKYLRVKMEGTTLHAYYENNGKGSVRIEGPSIIYVSSPKLENIDLSSSACLDIKSDLKLDGEIDIDISSAASVVATEITCGELKIDGSSSADVKCSAATCAYAEIDLSSSADVKILNLKGGNLDIDLSSSAGADILAFEGDKLKIDVSSAADANVGDIDCQSIYVEASSGADVTLSGKTRQLARDISSGATLNTSGLTIKH